MSSPAEDDRSESFVDAAMVGYDSVLIDPTWRTSTIPRECRQKCIYLRELTECFDPDRLNKCSRSTNVRASSAMLISPRSRTETLFLMEVEMAGSPAARYPARRTNKRVDCRANGSMAMSQPADRLANVVSLMPDSEYSDAEADLSRRFNHRPSITNCHIGRMAATSEQRQVHALIDDAAPGEANRAMVSRAVVAIELPGSAECQCWGKR